MGKTVTIRERKNSVGIESIKFFLIEYPSARAYSVYIETAPLAP
jgi:hypothetical protein